MATLQLLQCQPGQVQHPQRMGEATGFGAMKCQKGWPQLAHPAQPLEGGCIDQVDGQGFGRIGPIQADRPVQGIVIRALPHGQRLPSRRRASKRLACSSHVSPSPPGSSGSGWGRARSGSMPWVWMSRPLGVR